MKWMIGLGVSLTLIAATTAGESVSAYPPGWLATDSPPYPMTACPPSVCDDGAACEPCCDTNLWDSVRARFNVGNDCGGASCRGRLNARSHCCQEKFVNWLCWKPGPAVIPRCIPTPYPGEFLASFPCVPCRQYTPGAPPASCHSCDKSQGNGPMPIQGGHRILPGGPVLMPRSGPPITATVVGTSVPTPVPAADAPAPGPIADVTPATRGTPVRMTHESNRTLMRSSQYTGTRVKQPANAAPATSAPPATVTTVTAPLLLYAPTSSREPGPAVMTPRHPFTNP